MTTAKFVQPNYNTQTGTGYPLGIDAAFAAFLRLAGSFAPHAQDTPNLTVALDAGHVFGHNSGALIEVAAQNTAALTAPATNPRKDIVYVDRLTGVVGVATGTEAASPVDPAVPAGKSAIARIRCTVGMTAIANSQIDDLRNLGLLGVDQLLGALDAMVFKGVIDCSANPNYPAADAGFVYRVSVAGKIGGAAGPKVEVGDVLLCLTDGTAAGNHATVGANWNITQTNIDGTLGASVVAHKNANYAIVQADSGKTFVADAALDFTLPQISTLALPFEVTVKLGAATGTSMGAVCSGTDKIVAGGAEIGTTKTNVRGCFMKLVADSTGKWQAVMDRWEYESSLQSVGTSSAITLTHYFGALPADKYLILVCAITEGGWVVGDEVDGFSEPDNCGAELAADATNLYISQAGGVPRLPPKTGGAWFAITAANWRWKARASL